MKIEVLDSGQSRGQRPLPEPAFSAFRNGLLERLLGNPFGCATEQFAGEAQCIKLTNEFQRVQRGNPLYVLDEPTTGLHPSDVDRLIIQLDTLVDREHGQAIG